MNIHELNFNPFLSFEIGGMAALMAFHYDAQFDQKDGNKVSLQTDVTNGKHIDAAEKA